MKTTVKITFLTLVLASIIATSCNKPILNTPIEKILEDGTWELTEHMLTPNIIYGYSSSDDFNETWEYLDLSEHMGYEEYDYYYYFNGRRIYKLKEENFVVIDTFYNSRYSIEYKDDKPEIFWTTSNIYLPALDSIAFDIKSYNKYKIELIHSGDSLFCKRPGENGKIAYYYTSYEIKKTYKKK